MIDWLIAIWVEKSQNDWFTLSWLDYCLPIDTGTVPYSVSCVWQHPPLQVVLDLNWSCDDVSSALRELHWLPLTQRVIYVWTLFARPQSIAGTTARPRHKLTSASRCHSIAVLTAIWRDTTYAGDRDTTMQVNTSRSDFCRAMLCITVAYAVMRCLSVRLSVRVSVTFVDHVKTNKHIVEIF